MPAPILYPYQRRWLADKSRLKAGMFCRQSGKTFTTMLEVALDLTEAELKGRRTRWVILSRGERQAKEAMDEGLKLHLRALNMAFEAVESEIHLEDRTTVNALEVTTVNGSKVTALPANPDTARGFSANVVLDEFGFHRDSRKIWQALYPVISKPELKLRVISTPNGKGNKFYDIMTDKTGVWSRYTTDIYQAVADGLPRDIDDLRRGCGDPDTWAQEYELQWLDEASAWLSFDLINSVEDETAGKPDLYQRGPCYVGVDIGRRNDLFVIVVLELVGDVLWCREIIAEQRISFAAQDALLARVMRDYHVVRVAMDQTGMGEKPVEDAQRLYGSTRVEGVLFTAPRKMALATVGKQRFEDHKIRIPAGDQDLRSDLHRLQKTVGATGVPRFDAASDDKGHADRTWGFFLACAAAEGAGEAYDYTPATERSKRDDDERGLIFREGAF